MQSRPKLARHVVERAEASACHEDVYLMIVLTPRPARIVLTQQRKQPRFNATDTQDGYDVKDSLRGRAGDGHVPRNITGGKSRQNSSAPRDATIFSVLPPSSSKFVPGIRF